MSAILRAEPPELRRTGHRAGVPASRDGLRCLEKQPASRFQSASDLAFALQTAASDSRTSGSTSAIGAEPARRRGGASLAIGTALVVVAALAGLGAWKWWPAGAAAAPVRAELALPANLQLGPNVALSPDGREVIFTASRATSSALTGDPVGSLWLRVLSTGEMRELPNTDRALAPFWSPDGTAVGFFADGSLRISELSVWTSARVVHGAWRPRLGHMEQQRHASLRHREWPAVDARGGRWQSEAGSGHAGVRTAA